jgi:hypothetical protein
MSTVLAVPVQTPSKPIKVKSPDQHCVIEDYYDQYKATKRDVWLKRIYDEVMVISRNMVIRAYGPAGRIRMDEVTHDVATSVIMNIIMKNKTVDNWFKLLKKMSNNLACRWMLKHLYRNNNTWSLEGMDREQEEFRDEIPDYQIGYAETESLQVALETVLERADSLLHQFQKPQEVVCARTAMQLACGEKGVLLAKMQPRQVALTRFIQSRLEVIFQSIVDEKLLARQLAGGME